MTIKSRVVPGILFLLVLVSVVLLGVMQADSANSGFPYGPASRNQILRGRYLVTAVAGCADCHSPKKNPNDRLWLAGYTKDNPEAAFQIAPGITVYAANITPDQETGIGSWTPQQVFNALHYGKDDEGNTLCPPMPWPVYRQMSDRDIWSIVAYLKQGIKPVKNEVPENTGPGGQRPNCSPLYQNLQPLPTYPAANEIGVSKS